MNTEEVKFTPGPWGVERCEVSERYHIDAGGYPYGTLVCEVEEKPREGDAKANAKLIAAAPDLFAALAQIEEIPPVAFTRNQQEMANRTIERMQEIAREAIRKATQI